MPQLEFGDYAPQIAWLFVSFVVLLLLMWRVALPRIGRVLEERETRIADDLAQAEKLRSDAQSALDSYQAALAEARSKAHTVLAETQAKLDAEAAERRARLDDELTQKSAEAETRIRQAREQALSNVRDVAADVARTATERLIGIAPDRQASEAATDAAMSRKS